MRDSQLETNARKAADELARRLNLTERDIPVALVLGTGWGDTIKLENQSDAVPLTDLPGFEALGNLTGHDRSVVAGVLAGRRVVVLRGRVHLNEHWCNPALGAMVRLQAEMLFHLGVKRLVLTCAAGALAGSGLNVGDVCVFDGFVTIHNAAPMPLTAGEFCSPEDALDEGLRQLALEEGNRPDGGLRAQVGGYAMVRGPFFEGRRYDKAILAKTGASTVGMSVLPETCVAALYPEVKVLAIGFVTNSDSEEHSHESNLAQAKAKGQHLSNLLERIVARLD